MTADRVTRGVRSHGLRTRPVTKCLACGEAIGDELVNAGERLLWLRSLKVASGWFHPDCFETWSEGKWRSLPPRPQWRTCLWCYRRWWRVARTSNQPSTGTGYCTDTCRKAAARAREHGDFVVGKCRCGQRIEGRRADAEYCSDACRQYFYRCRRAMREFVTRHGLGDRL